MSGGLTGGYGSGVAVGEIWDHVADGGFLGDHLFHFSDFLCMVLATFGMCRFGRCSLLRMTGRRWRLR